MRIPLIAVRGALGLSTLLPMGFAGRAVAQAFPPPQPDRVEISHRNPTETCTADSSTVALLKEKLDKPRKAGQYFAIGKDVIGFQGSDYNFYVNLNISKETLPEEVSPIRMEISGQSGRILSMDGKRKGGAVVIDEDGFRNKASLVIELNDQIPTILQRGDIQSILKNAGLNISCEAPRSGS
jgi:hypothetical protein